MRKPWIKNRRLGVWLGAGGFVVSCLILYDVYERRGGRSPIWVRVFAPM
jgi:hypothetical protein